MCNACITRELGGLLIAVLQKMLDHSSSDIGVNKKKVTYYYRTAMIKFLNILFYFKNILIFKLKHTKS